MPILRVGEPGGHFLKDYGGFDRLCPRPRVLVNDQGHRGNLSGPVAALTVFLENWKDVLVEGHGGRKIGCQNGCPEHQPHENHAHHMLAPLAEILTTDAGTLPSILESIPRSNGVGTFSSPAMINRWRFNSWMTAHPYTIPRRPFEGNFQITDDPGLVQRTHVARFSELRLLR